MSKELRFRINASKTKRMVIDSAGCLPESDVLKDCEKVDTFVYLCFTIKVNGGSSNRNTGPNCFEKISEDETMECHL